MTEQIIKTGIASEGGHWYTADGDACYQIEMKSKPGEFRPVNLRDARKLNLVPSVTTITKGVLAAPGLERWKQEQILLAALTLPKIDGESLDDFARRVREDGAEQARKAAEKGTAIHAAIEASFSGDSYPEEFAPYAEAAREAVHALHDFGAWQAEKSFAHPLGFGGKVDLHSTACPVVIDFKTKEFTADDLAGKRPKKLWWDEMAIQLAAYRVGLNIPDAKCVNIFVSVNEPGTTHTHVWDEPSLETGWEIFRRALEIWQLQKGYVPKFKEAA